MAETILTTVRPGPAERLRRYLRLTKPRVNTLIVFCAVIGMFLAAPGMVPLQALFAGTLGIALVAGAAAAMNCLIEQEIDLVLASPQMAGIDEMLTYAAIGTREVVRDYLGQFREHADADELMVVHQASSVASRMRSLDILADAMSLTALRN